MYVLHVCNAYIQSKASIVARSTELSAACATLTFDWTLAQADQFIFDLSDERPRWQLNEQVQHLLPLSFHQPVRDDMAL